MDLDDDMDLENNMDLDMKMIMDINARSAFWRQELVWTQTR